MCVYMLCVYGMCCVCLLCVVVVVRVCVCVCVCVCSYIGLYWCINVGHTGRLLLHSQSSGLLWTYQLFLNLRQDHRVCSACNTD